MELKQKVFHIKHGAGIVEKTKNNGAIIGVDFKGMYKEVGRDELHPPKNNSYTPKEDLINIDIKDLDRFINDYKESYTPYSNGAVVGLTQFKEFLLNKIT